MKARLVLLIFVGIFLVSVQIASAGDTIGKCWVNVTHPESEDYKEHRECVRPSGDAYCEEDRCLCKTGDRVLKRTVKFLSGAYVLLYTCENPPEY